MELYNIMFYIIIFIMGTFFGSFFTLAVYRIPRKEDITHKHSYCPNCNHKLGFLDMIPIFSYIFLRGRCRYCRQKIRPRYLVLECLSGLVFVTIALIMNIFNNPSAEIEFAFIALYIVFITLMAGIDKENKKIQKSVSIYGVIISLMYIAYLCIVENANIYRYVIYLIFYIVVLVLDSITLKRFAKSSYVNGILLTVITMAIFTGEYVTINAIIFVLLIIFVYMLLSKIKENSRKNKLRHNKREIADTLSIGFLLGIANIIYFIIVTAYINLV